MVAVLVTTSLANTKHYETVGQYYEKGIMVELAALNVATNEQQTGVVNFSNGYVNFQFLDETRNSVKLTPTLDGVSYLPIIIVYNDESS